MGICIFFLRRGVGRCHKPGMGRNSLDCDVAVLGAGASGLVCALAAARAGLRVAVFDHAEVCGRKLRVCGGGRANFTNRTVGFADYFGQDPQFARQALARFGTREILGFFEGLGLTGVEADRGKMFCVQGAQAMADTLHQAGQDAGARFVLGVGIAAVEREGLDFVVRLSGPCPKPAYRAGAVVLALGGISWPQIGATNLGHDLARRFGLPVSPLRPGLTPLPAPEDLLPLCRELTGISLPVAMTTGRRKGDRRGPPEPVESDLLFTHTGISGPAVLEASMPLELGDTVHIDFLPGQSVLDLLAENPTQTVKGVLSRTLPRKLALALAGRCGAAEVQVANLPKAAAAGLAKDVHAFAFTPGREGSLAKAEVTKGGVLTRALDPRTMAAREVNGLYVLGELQDISGRLGGFNLHWAFACALACAQALAAR